MEVWKLHALYMNEYKEEYKLVSLKTDDNPEKMLEITKTDIESINKIMSDTSYPVGFKEIIHLALLKKTAYYDYIIGEWKKETDLEKQISILKKILTLMDNDANKYCNDCHNNYIVKKKMLLEDRLKQPIPTNLLGHVYDTNVTNDYIHRPEGYNILELHIPYYDLYMNVGNNDSQGGLNLFLDDGYRGSNSTPIKTVTIPPEIAKRIHDSAKELILNRPEIYKYITDILR